MDCRVAWVRNLGISIDQCCLLPPCQSTEKQGLPSPPPGSAPPLVGPLLGQQASGALSASRASPFIFTSPVQNPSAVVREGCPCQRPPGSGAGSLSREGSCILTTISLQAPFLASANQDHADLPAFSLNFFHLLNSEKCLNNQDGADLLAFFKTFLKMFGSEQISCSRNSIIPWPSTLWVLPPALGDSRHSRTQNFGMAALERTPETISSGTSLAVQWLRIHFPVQKMQVQSLVRELEADGPLSPWAATTEPVRSRASTPQPESLHTTAKTRCGHQLITSQHILLFKKETMSSTLPFCDKYSLLISYPPWCLALQAHGLGKATRTDNLNKQHWRDGRSRAWWLGQGGLASSWWWRRGALTSGPCHQWADPIHGGSEEQRQLQPNSGIQTLALPRTSRAPWESHSTSLCLRFLLWEMRVLPPSLGLGRIKWVHTCNRLRIGPGT